MVPTPPMADLISRQARLALAPLEAFFETVLRLGHPGTLPPRGLGCGLGERNFHLHHLRIVSGSGPSHHHHLLVAVWTPRCAYPHAAFDHGDPQRPFGTVAHVAPLPRAFCKRCPPGIGALPGTLRAAPPPAVWRLLDLQGMEQRVARDSQPRAWASTRQATTAPSGPTHGVLTRHPPWGSTAPCGSSISSAHG